MASDSENGVSYRVIMPVPWPFWGLFLWLGWEPYTESDR